MLIVILNYLTADIYKIQCPLVLRQELDMPVANNLISIGFVALKSLGPSTRGCQKDALCVFNTNSTTTVNIHLT